MSAGCGWTTRWSRGCRNSADRRVLKRPDGPLDDTVPARRPITVRDLLTSTFGLGMDMTSPGTPIMNAIFEQGLTPNLPEPMPEPDEWMRRLGTLPLMHHPGEHWQYQISNDLLGVPVARVTGRSFETFLRERIFDPLGMKDTGFHVPADQIDRLPTLYAPDPQTGEFGVGEKRPGPDATASLRPSRAAAAVWSPPSMTTTPTSGCCSMAGCAGISGSCPGPPSS
ncbi:serine hydrolase domain-containing protein [Streptosporangium roseum]|uniref:serine hydrolase domain-containing protein n=1 Tax=Streptosporangium roseum TaxID=2001 RepID=UPI00332676D7